MLIIFNVLIAKITILTAKNVTLACFSAIIIT